MAVWPSWLEIAAEDLKSARTLIHADIDRTGAYHLQQAAEKMLKAVLISERISYPAISHSLSDLLGHLRTDHPLREDFRELVFLGSYATSFRYPTAAGRVKGVNARDDLGGALEAMERMMPEVRQRCDEAWKAGTPST